jgi:hypothetical protein
MGFAWRWSFVFSGREFDGGISAKGYEEASVYRNFGWIMTGDPPTYRSPNWGPLLNSQYHRSFILILKVPVSCISITRSRSGFSTGANSLKVSWPIYLSHFLAVFLLFPIECDRLRRIFGIFACPVCAGRSRERFLPAEGPP